LKNKELNVSLPFYNDKTVNTKDLFYTSDNNQYIFQGRNDLIKINGLVVNKNAYTNIIQTFGLTDFCIVFDIFENKIYLAIEDQTQNVEEVVYKIKNLIEKVSNQKHTIDKFAKLDLNEFMSGVKLDHELLRSFFRKYC
jgi:hypothetical protein